MRKIVGIRFKAAGKVYDFDPGAFVLNRGDHVIVETEQGFGFGTVAAPPVEVDETAPSKPLKKIYRMAGDKDFIQLARNQETEKRAFQYCQECVAKLGLQMNLFCVESNFDASKLTFFFTAEGRVDFRQLVKMLVRELATKVEMRQVGIRNQAKMCGGVGRCGQEICCARFIEKFSPVSIRMAKEQGLSLNPTKISGLCGRLMCCLTYEYETYRELRADLPKVGKNVTTAMGKGRVIRHNLTNRRFVVRLPDGQETEIGLEDIVKEPREVKEPTEPKETTEPKERG
jgi:cell fate regulator YaaT (PSP1 superfamily)